MNILFLFQRFSFGSSTIYLDLVKECVSAGHTVYVLAGTSEEVDTNSIVSIDGFNVVYVPLPDQFHAGKIKKGLVQLAIKPIFLSRLKRFLWDKKIDLIAYPTPPITLARVVAKAKKHYNATTYLMLKDIFPQNAVDLRMMKDKSLIFKYFKHVEKMLYEVSDHIGCMSPANIEYMKTHSDSAICERLELFPNTVAIKDEEDGIDKAPEMNIDAQEAKVYAHDAAHGSQISDTAVNFVFGGNLGKPQAVDFLLEGILSLRGYKDAHFLIIGDGTMASLVEEFIRDNKLSNAEYHKQLPRDEYEQILKNQDVGIISLSPDFTIPNFPSRLLSYMQMKKPVLVVTDTVSDMGDIVTSKARCGFFTPSDSLDDFVKTIKTICENKGVLSELGENGHRYLCENYNVKNSVKILEKAIAK